MRTQLVPLVAAAAVVAVPVAAAPRAAYAPPLERHTNPAGWRIDFPGSWRLERSGHACRYAVGQGTVATFAMARAVNGHRKRASCGFSVRPPLDLERLFPPSGVALRVLCAVGGRFRAPPRRPVFPLTVEQLEPEDASVPTHGAPRPRTLELAHHGTRYRVSVWVGGQATEARRRDLERVLASLRFMRARPRPGGLQRCEPN